MRQLNILFVIPTMQQGGAERVLSLMANYWVEKGKQISVTVFDNNTPFYTLNPAIKYYPLNSAQSKFGIFNFAFNNFIRTVNYLKNIKKIKPDVIISFTDNANVYTILYALFSKRPLIITQRTNPHYITLPKIIRFLPRLIYRRANAMVVQTSQTKSIYKLLKISLPKTVAVIYNPLNEAIYKPQPAAEKKNIVLAVGRLYNRDKHFNKLIDIFNATNNNEWQLFIAGDGPDRKMLEEKIEILQLTKKVRLLGSLNNLAPLYQTAKIFVLTSEYEGFPNALCEAMANGCACISYDCATGPAEIIDNGNNGILVKPGNQHEFTQQLNALMHNDAKINELSKAALNLREVLSETKIMQQWEQLINSIVPQKK